MKKVVDILTNLGRFNMRNIVVGCVLFVWTFAMTKAFVLKQDFSPQLMEIVGGLKEIMLIVLGFYLKATIFRGGTTQTGTCKDCPFNNDQEI